VGAATLPAGLLGHDELPEQHAERLGLHHVRVGGQEVIAEEAFLIVPIQSTAPEPQL